MSDDKPVEGTAPRETVPAAAEPAPKQSWTDRRWGFKAVIAVALASLIIGGLGGAALADLGGRDGDDRTGPGFGHQFRSGPGQGRGPKGFVPPGQLKKQERRDDRGEQRGRDNS